MVHISVKRGGLSTANSVTSTRRLPYLIPGIFFILRISAASLLRAAARFLIIVGVASTVQTHAQYGKVSLLSADGSQLQPLQQRLSNWFSRAGLE